MIVDKKSLLPNLQDAFLELGCGPKKKFPSSIGIDVIDYDCVDIVGDAFEVLERIPSESIKTVCSHHFFEHVRDVGTLMSELERVLKPGGTLDISVPHFSNPYFYSDYTHRSFFGLYSFSYFCSDRLLQRQVPKYRAESSFDLFRVDLIFKSPPPFYVRYGFKRLLQLVFNLNAYTKEFYEENCCYLFPCYEIRFQIRKRGTFLRQRDNEGRLRRQMP